MSRDRGGPGAAGPESGLSFLELLVALTIGLLVAIAIYELVDWSSRTHRGQSDLATAQATGRGALELMTSDLRHAGYSPLGAAFLRVPAGDAQKLRILADLDGDTIVGVAGESGENLSYLFSGPSADGTWRLQRGVDLDGDWAFTGAGESVETIAEGVVPVDVDGDGTQEPFLSFENAPPATSRITVSFGIQAAYRDPLKKSRAVAAFHDSVALRSGP